MPETDESQIKLITLNIEGDNHLSRVLPFLKQEQADVICLQEALEKDIDYFKHELSMAGYYVPFAHVKYPNNVRLPLNTSYGLLFLTKLVLMNISVEYYVGNKDVLPNFDENNSNTMNRALLIGDVMKGNTSFRIITTHFIWSSQGRTTPLQHQMLDRVFSILDSKGDFVLCGDFNAPRGKEVWGRIEEQYTDNVPRDIETTVDSSLHRSGNTIQFVVDGMFSTKGYTVGDVKVISGVSDHKALVGFVKKN